MLVSKHYKLSIRCPALFNVRDAHFGRELCGISFGVASVEGVKLVYDVTSYDMVVITSSHYDYHDWDERVFPQSRWPVQVKAVCIVLISGRLEE